MKKYIVAIILAVLIISSLSVTLGSAETEVTTANTDVSILRSWVQLNGAIKQRGSTPINGSISVQAGALKVNDTLARASVKASATWDNGTAKPIGNFTWTYYAANLVFAEKVRRDFEGNNFYLNGTWVISNVTVTNTVITNNGVVSRHRDVNTVTTKAIGQLNVTDNWTKFTLAIKDIEPLTGVVHRVLTSTVQVNVCKVSDDGNTKVTIKDLLVVVRAYGAIPGMKFYDQKLDFNCHYKIDITNLATVAANVGQ